MHGFSSLTVRTVVDAVRETIAAHVGRVVEARAMASKPADATRIISTMGLSVGNAQTDYPVDLWADEEAVYLTPDWLAAYEGVAA